MVQNPAFRDILNSYTIWQRLSVNVHIELSFWTESNHKLPTWFLYCLDVHDFPVSAYDTSRSDCDISNLLTLKFPCFSLLFDGHWFFYNPGTNHSGKDNTERSEFGRDEVPSEREARTMVTCVYMKNKA
jgi:hypothetical protein